MHAIDDKPRAACTVVPEDLDKLTDEWVALLHEAERPWPFLRPSWLRAWWEEQEAGAELVILAVRDADRLVGVIPLLRRDGDLKLAGDSEICDYMDIIAEPGREDDVLEALLAFLDATPWQRFSFWGIRADSPTLPALQQIADRWGFALEIEPEAVCPRVQLPDTWEGYLQSLSKKDRHELRRKIRRLSEAGSDVQEYALSDPDAIDGALGDFFRLHVISRQDKAQFMSPEMERFFRRMTSGLSRENLIRLYFLELDGQRMASVLAFDCGNEVWLYNSGFDPAYASVSVGLVSKALALRQAIAEGKRCYDFLRGAEPYKYDLGATDLQVLRCTLMRSGASRETVMADGV